jgi:hypothetical protein
MLPPTGKSLKKGGPGKISNKVVYVHCVSKAVGQTNLCPPPQTILGLYAHVVPCLPHLETFAFIEETKFVSRKAKIIKYFLPNSQTFDETLSPFADTGKTISHTETLVRQII